MGQSSDTSGPFSLDRGPPFELEAELAKEFNRLSEVFDDDSYIIHPLERHASNLQGVVPTYKVSPSTVRVRRLNPDGLKTPPGFQTALTLLGRSPMRRADNRLR
jgi:hypothetical protein